MPNQVQLHTTGPNHFKNYDGDKRKKIVIISIFLVLIFTIIEVIGGYLSNSVALLADASHMFTDFISLIFTLFGISVAKLSNNSKKTYGYSRIEVILSLVNSLFLIFISFFIVYESINRFINPTTINASIMLPVAIAGLLINFIVMYLFSYQKGSHENNNQNLLMQSTFLHFLSDTFGSIIAIAVAIIIIYTNWFIVDPILSIIFVSLINFSAIKIIISSFHILMESSPKNIKAQDIKEELEKVASVINIHHIHLWMLNEEENLITLHCLIENNGDITKITKELKEKLVSVFNINHSTIQIELDSSACLN